MTVFTIMEKLKRLLRYYEVKDMKHVIKSSVSLVDETGKAEVLANEEKKKDSKIMGKNRQVCYDFLSAIDQTGELLALFDDKDVDPVKHERLLASLFIFLFMAACDADLMIIDWFARFPGNVLDAHILRESGKSHTTALTKSKLSNIEQRAELQSQGMDTKQYLDFCQARQANFSRKYTKSQRFRDWLQLNLKSEIQLSAAAVELFSYMAYEAVAQIVDLALLVKQDQRARPGDPVSKHIPGLCVNYTDLYVGSVYSREDVASQSSGLDVHTPADGLHVATGSFASKYSKKKRKKSGSLNSVDSDWNNTILPEDIREACRRYFLETSPFASINKYSSSHHSPWKANLCT
ncbi:hypothetical protein RRG08_036531 [Elysia crispata]|uniref:Uncharacterized protein n=1 Tax=Elysia crispata TaxID=231223 RepID=A0AAE0YXC0_9GAST|nr:hypothetical protein RRG08_036531 [Elysia crispata]